MTLTLVTWAELYLYPILVTLALWGGLTVGVVWLNRHGKMAGRWALLLLLPALALAHQQLWAMRDDVSIWGCYGAFTAGMFIWAWHELAFYCGILTGPWRAPCPPHLSGWQRFGYALRTHIYHEIAVVIEVGLLWWLHHDATNPVGYLTFGFLWALQHSAKLNVLLGIRNLQVSLFPEHLRYLGSFWQQRSHNPFFFASVTVTSLLAIGFWIYAGMLAPAESAVGMTLLASLMTLGAIEHWILVMPGMNWGEQPEAVLNKPAKPEARQWKAD
jgi:putative photosynthetic complex assembly protein 2